MIYLNQIINGQRAAWLNENWLKASTKESNGLKSQRSSSHGSESQYHERTQCADQERIGISDSPTTTIGVILGVLLDSVYHF